MSGSILLIIEAFACGIGFTVANLLLNKKVKKATTKEKCIFGLIIFTVVVVVYLGVGYLFSRL